MTKYKIKGYAVADCNGNIIMYDSALNCRHLVEQAKEQRFEQLCDDFILHGNKPIPDWMPNEGETVKQWMTRTDPDEFQIPMIPDDATFDDVIRYNNGEIYLEWLRNLDTAPRESVCSGGDMWEYIQLRKEFLK